MINNIPVPSATHSTVHDFKVFINSCHSIISIETSEENRVQQLLTSTTQQLNMDLEEWTIISGIQNKHTGGLKLIDTDKPSGLINYMMDRRGEVIYLLKDFHSCLEDPIVIRKFRELAQKFNQTRSTIFLTGPKIQLPFEIEHLAIPYNLTIPSEAELKELVKNVYHFLSKKHQVAYNLNKKGEASLLFALRGMTIDQARQAVASAFLDDQALTNEDIPDILAKKAQLINEGGLLEFLSPSENQFQLGGFRQLKMWLNKARIGFSQQARKLNLPIPKGILLVGIPGCGKSLVAKIVANVWGFPLLKLDTGRLFDKYIGESEKNFRKCIQVAESMAPSVLWIDEIEKAMAQEEATGADGGLGRRLFGSFLTWLQEKEKAVFVVATANQIHQMPPELLRKGRFDEIFFVDLPLNAARKEIFKIHLTQRNLSSQDYDIDLLAKESKGLTGAEIEQVVLSSLYRCLHKKTPHNTSLILEETKQIIPLSQSKREFVNELRRRYKSRFKNVHTV